VSSDTDYEIVTRIKVRDEADRGIDGVQRKLKGVEREGKRVGLSLTSAIGGAFAAIGGGALFGGIARGILSVNGELEQANAGMATLLSGIAQMPIADAISVARSQVQGLREDAAEGVGELSDYMRGFQMLLGPGLTGGASLDQLRTLTRTSLAAGFAQRGTTGLEQAPMDIVQALTSGVNDRQTPIALSALQAINVEAGTFNKLQMTEKIETLTRAFGAFDEGVALMGQTWDAQMATLQDRTKGLFQIASQPLYDRWSEQLQDANGWLSDHSDKLEDMADRWGRQMVVVWDAIISKAKVYAAILAGAALAPAVPAVAAGAGRLGVGVAAGAALARRNVASLGVGTMLTARTAGLVPVAGLLGRGALAGVSKLLTPLVRLAGPLALAAMLFSSMHGALVEFPGVLSFVTGAWGTLMLSLDQLAESFGLLNGRGSLLNLAGATLVGVLGGLMYGFSFGVKVIATLTTGIATFFRVLGAAIQGAWAALQGRKDPFAAVLKVANASNKHLNDIWTDWKPPPLPELPEVGDGDGDLKPPSRITNINGPVNVTVEVETAEDPARVAATWDNVLDRVRRNRLQARRGAGPVFTGA